MWKNKLTFRRLHSSQEFETFAGNFQKSIQEKSSEKTYGGAPIPLSYFQDSHVVGVFDKDNRMVAGYIIGLGKPFRLLEFVPAESRSSITLPDSARWEDCCELTCAWRFPEVSPVFMSFRFWPHANFSAIRSGKKLCLGHNQNARLDELYTQAGPVSLYTGISTYGLPSRLFAYTLRWGYWYTLCFILVETPRRCLKLMSRRIQSIKKRSA